MTVPTREHDRFLAAVREGLADAEAGRVIEDEDLAAELDAEFDPRSALWPLPGLPSDPRS